MSKPKTLARLRSWLSRWQEFVIWLPVLFVIAVVAYVLLGAVARIGADPLAWLAEIPVMCAWAAVACATAWLIKRTYLHDIDADSEALLFQQLLLGDRNARWVYMADRLEWLVILLLSFAFFWPAR